MSVKLRFFAVIGDYYATGKYCPLDEDCRRLLEMAMYKPGLSVRAYSRIIKVARTIADLEGEAAIGASQVAEAIQYRTLDRGVG